MLLIATRYVSSFGRKSFIGFISIASVIGIALGVMVLITVLSVMNGFRAEVRERMLSLSPHLTVQAREPWPHWQHITTLFQNRPEITGMAPFLDVQGLFKVGSQVTGILVRGILPKEVDHVFPLSKHLIAGSVEDLLPGRFNVIIGSELAKNLGLNLGDKLTLLVPEVSVSITGMMPRLRQLTISGIFRVGYVFDHSLAFMDLTDLQTLRRLPDHVSGLQIQLRDPFEAYGIGQEWNKGLPPGLHMIDWTTQNQHYFQAVKMEKTMMFFILLLIVGIAAFNLVSTLVMVVTDKRPDIAVLRTMGAKTKTIMFIFIEQGLILGSIGTLLGVVLGIILALNVSGWVAAIERFFHFDILPPEVYYIHFLPSRLSMQDVWIVSASSLVLCLIATLYPAYKAARIPPAEALRYA